MIVRTMTASANALIWSALLIVPLGCSKAQDAPLPAPKAGGTVAITAFGQIGTPDDSGVFQAAVDSAESHGATLVIPSGSVVNLRANVYLGNITLAAAGSTINCYYDGNFHVRGSARLRTQGCILTKAADQAGYGRSTVAIKFDSLTINTIRSVGGPDAKIGLLLENTSKFAGSTLSGTAKGTGEGEVTPFDFRTGVQGVTIDRVVGHMQNGAGPGGFWMRNDSPQRATADIDIGTVQMDGATADELLAIFNSQQPGADLHDIYIGTVMLHPDGGCGQGLAIFRNAGNYDPTKMQRIAIDRVEVDVGRIGPKLSRAPGVFAVKVSKADAQIGPIAISYSGAWVPGLPQVYGVRFSPGPGQTKMLTVPSITVTVNGKNAIPLGDAAMVWGPVDAKQIIVRGNGTGFRQIANGARGVGHVDAQTRAFSGDPFSNSQGVRGQLNGGAVDH